MAVQEYKRIAQMLSGMTVSVPMALMTKRRIEEIENRATIEPTLATLHKELKSKLKAVRRPEDHPQMAQAYEAYAEATFWLEMLDRGVRLDRTPGTGQNSQQRPDFVHHHQQGDIYFEVKALEVADPLARHKEIAYISLEAAADLDERARNSGVHIGEPQEISGHLPGVTLAKRIDTTIDKITNNVKAGQIYFGPTVLVVDLGRFDTIPYGPSSLLPVFYHDETPAESCVSGELWQISQGQLGEQLFSLPDFDGKSNLGGHQNKNGILREFDGLMAITFVHPRWSEKSELLTLWNPTFKQDRLTNTCTVNEAEIGRLLHSYSDGLNDTSNELGWPFRVIPLRKPPTSP